VSPAAPVTAGHRQNPPAIPPDTSPTIATPTPLIAGGGIVAAADAPNETEPDAVSKLVGISGHEGAELAVGSDLASGFEAERAATKSSDASPAGAGHKAGVVRGQHAFPPAPAATGPGPGPGPAMPGAVAAEPAVIGDGVAEDGTTDARIPGTEASETVPPALVPGLGAATDPGLEPYTGEASHGGASRQQRSVIAGLRRELDARRRLVLAAAAVLVVAVGLGSWLSLTAGASHRTGTQQLGTQSAKALTRPATAGPSLPGTIGNPVTTPTTHPATHRATPTAEASTPPVARPSPDVTSPTGPQLVNIPDTIDETVIQAIQVLEAEGFQVQIVGLGQGPYNLVIDYKPVGQAARGATVTIVVTKSGF
jgi:hypothetical protein